MKFNILRVATVVLGYVVATLGTGWLIGQVSKKMIKKEEDENFKRMIESGLPNAGKIIGWLERTLIVTFILVGNYNGIGFILAAKGILRFGEIKEGPDRKFAEYVILGTLLSFSLSFLVGILMRYLLGLSIGK